MARSAALIGYTGFVGTALDDGRFAIRLNSKNIEDAAGSHFSTVVCAGVQAVKWWANKNPEEDWRGITRLLDVLNDITADRFVLISTVDVFGDPNCVDEETPIQETGLHPYGLHRYRVEEFVQNRFGDAAVIVRLPGLFGPHLKKNLIFDLLEGRDVSGFNPGSTFQFYDITRLRSDLDVIEDSGEKLIHLATEPLSVAGVGQALNAPIDAFSATAPEVHYDMQTRHGALWGRDSRYIADTAETARRIKVLGETWSRR